MPLARLDAGDVVAAVGEALGTEVVSVERLDVGYANDSWRVATGSGDSFTAKFGPHSSEAKWRSAARASTLAAGAGVPLATQVYMGTHGPRLLRLFPWVDGVTPASVWDDPSIAATCFTELGRAVAALHSIPVERFSSRLDGSAPSFDRWRDYIDHRVLQIVDRCHATDAVPAPLMARVTTELEGLAASVSPVCRPTLCHRDLHTDNLLVDDQGHLTAILDFDMAEAWDTAGEWFKLSWWLFPACRGAEDAFDRGYRQRHAEPELWTKRKRLVDLVETLNTIPNCITEGWDAAFEAAARRRLEDLLEGR